MKVEIRVRLVNKDEAMLNGVLETGFYFRDYVIKTKSSRTTFKLANNYIRKHTRDWIWVDDKTLKVTLCRKFEEVFNDDIMKDYKVIIE